MTSKPYSVADGKLRISGREIDTDYPVTQVICAGDKVVARLEIPKGTVQNNNVLCFGQDGGTLWIIQPSPHGGTEDNPYVFIGAGDDGGIIARNWNGVEYKVADDDGTVSPIGVRRF